MANKPGISRFNISNDASYGHGQRKGAGRAGALIQVRHAMPALTLATIPPVPQQRLHPWYLQHRPRGGWVPLPLQRVIIVKKGARLRAGCQPCHLLLLEEALLQASFPCETAALIAITHMMVDNQPGDLSWTRSVMQCHPCWHVVVMEPCSDFDGIEHWRRSPPRNLLHVCQLVSKLIIGLVCRSLCQIVHTACGLWRR